MVEMRLGRIIRHDTTDRNFVFLEEREGQRSFPIVIGRNEAEEIHRILIAEEPPRPLTHQLAFSVIGALGAEIKRCDIVDLRNNTFFAQLVLQTPNGDQTAVIDSRPSDAIALALRGRSPIRVAESILEQVRSDESGPDPLPPEPEPEPEPDEGD